MENNELIEKAKAAVDRYGKPQSSSKHVYNFGLAMFIEGTKLADTSKPTVDIILNFEKACKVYSESGIDLNELEFKLYLKGEPTVDKEELRKALWIKFQNEAMNETFCKGEDVYLQTIFDWFINNLQPQINTEDKWISIKDQEPPKDKAFIAFLAGGQQDFVCWSKAELCFQDYYYHSGVTNHILFWKLSQPPLSK